MSTANTDITLGACRVQQAQNANYPLRNLTSEDIKHLEDFLSDEDILSTDKIYVVAMLAGYKTGCSFSYVNPPEDYTELSGYKLAHSVGLSFVTTVTQTGGSEVRWFYLTTGAVDSIPPFEDTDPTVVTEMNNWEQYGRFLGIPEQDIAWWKDEKYPSSTGPPQQFIETCSPIDEYASVDLTQRELKYAHLVPYVPEPTKAGVERAVETGRAYRQAMTELEHLYGIHTHHILTDDELYDTDWFSPVRTSRDQ